MLSAWGGYRDLTGLRGYRWLSQQQGDCKMLRVRLAINTNILCRLGIKRRDPCYVDKLPTNRPSPGAVVCGNTKAVSATLICVSASVFANLCGHKVCKYVHMYCGRVHMWVYVYQGLMHGSIWLLAGPEAMARWQPHFCQTMGCSNLQWILYAFGFMCYLNGML